MAETQLNASAQPCVWAARIKPDRFCVAWGQRVGSSIPRGPSRSPESWTAPSAYDSRNGSIDILTGKTGQPETEFLRA